MDILQNKNRNQQEEENSYGNPLCKTPGRGRHCRDLRTGAGGRLQGLAGQGLENFSDAAPKEGRQGVVLTCKDRLVHYYAKFGFVDEGISDSTHGDVVCHHMRLTFNRK